MYYRNGDWLVIIRLISDYVFDYVPELVIEHVIKVNL